MKSGRVVLFACLAGLLGVGSLVTSEAAAQVPGSIVEQAMGCRERSDLDRLFRLHLSGDFQAFARAGAEFARAGRCTLLDPGLAYGEDFSLWSGYACVRRSGEGRCWWIEAESFVVANDGGSPAPSRPRAESPVEDRARPAPAAPSRADGFRSFDEEVRRADAALECEYRAITSSVVDGWPARLYGCYMAEDTVKWWINEDPTRPGQVLDVKLHWVEYHRDVGFGTHVGWEQAAYAVARLAELYAPDSARTLEATFFRSDERVFEAGPFKTEYKFIDGPGAYGRTFIVTRRPWDGTGARNAPATAAGSPGASIPVAPGLYPDRDACYANGRVFGLNPQGDGFLMVRSGPGTEYAPLERLYEGDEVWICHEEGPWLAIVYAPRGVDRTTCGVSSPWSARRSYTGPCRSGWSHSRWIDAYAG